MTDITHSALLFEASSKLQSASTWLDRMAKGELPDQLGKGLLHWVGAFLSRVDGPDLPDQSDSYGLSGQATNAKPAFYASLLRVRNSLVKQGLTTRPELQKFLGGLYGVLTTGTVENTSSSELRLGAELLHELSRGLLLQAEQPNKPRQDDSPSIV